MKNRTNHLPFTGRLLAAAVTLALLTALLTPCALGLSLPYPSALFYNDSLVVTVASDEERTFSEADFAAVDCMKVWVTAKTPTESGFCYELVVTVADPAWAMEALRQTPGVLAVERNDRYAPQTSYLVFDRQTLLLPVGEEERVSIAGLRLAEHNYQVLGVAFTLTGRPDKDALRLWGVARFWPETELKEEILQQQPEKLEGTVSESGRYYGLPIEGVTFFEATNRLAQRSAVAAVSVAVLETPPSGTPPYEEWRLSDPAAAQMTLSGGEVAPGFNENGPKLGQQATLLGLRPGIARLTVERGGPGAKASDSCLVIVYQPGGRENPGDVNGDGAVNAADALLTLRQAVGAAALPPAGVLRADLNADGAVNATDALWMLRFAVRKL